MFFCTILQVVQISGTLFPFCVGGFATKAGELQRGFPFSTSVTEQLGACPGEYVPANVATPLRDVILLIAGKDIPAHRVVAFWCDLQLVWENDYLPHRQKVQLGTEFKTIQAINHNSLRLCTCPSEMSCISLAHSASLTPSSHCISISLNVSLDHPLSNHIGSRYRQRPSDRRSGVGGFEVVRLLPRGWGSLGSQQAHMGLEHLQEREMVGLCVGFLWWTPTVR